METEHVQTAAELDASTAAVKLGDEKLQSDARQGTSLDNAEDVLSFDDFNDLLDACPSSAVTPIVNAYGHLLSLYQYALGRLQLLELIGANGVLTDALILRLQQLNDENDRLLQAERSHRDHLKELELQLEDQKRQSSSTEEALNDAHQLLQQQESELASQAKLVSELKDKYTTERSSYSHRRSDRPEESRTRHNSHEGSSRDKDRERSREHRSYRSGSRRHGEHEYEGRETEREGSVASSRRSSSRRDDAGHSRVHRDQTRIDRIHEDVEHQYEVVQKATSAKIMNDEAETPRQPASERGLSINGTALRATHGQSGSRELGANSQKLAKEPDHVIEEYEPEIDLGEDLYEEEPPLVKPAAEQTARTSLRSRSRSPHRHVDGHIDSDHRSNHTRTRSRSPHRDDMDKPARPHRRDRQDDTDRGSATTKVAGQSDDVIVNSSDQGERLGKRPRHCDDSSSKSRSNMYGRLGLPLSGGNSEGSRAQLAIKGAGRSSKR